MTQEAIDIWTLCTGKQYVMPLSIEPWRVVEAQHILSARDLVDTREEHELLEELIEQSKPQILEKKDYLIFTPFRYPPLKYGSRFGRVCERSLWYGSLELETAFAEVAYYRLKFLNDTRAELNHLEIPMTAFSTYVKTSTGVDLTLPPFNHYRKEISHPHSYLYSQTLGTMMRQEKIETVVYFSARTGTSEKNVAIFTPKVFHKKKNQHIHQQQTWSCRASKHVLEFIRLDLLKKERFSFFLEQFEGIK